MPPDELGLRGVDGLVVQDKPPPSTPGPVSAPAQTGRPHALKILILEDDPNDAELITHELRKAGLDFTARRVGNRADFVAALDTFAPDILLADYRLPDFNGAEALAHVRQVHPEIPVVMVTGTLGEEAAVELLKAGAKDYVLKSSLLRLPSAVERAIAVEQGIRARKSAEAALRGSNALLQTAERIAHIGGFEWDVASGQVVWSEELYRMFGQSPGQFVPTRANFIDCVHPDDREHVQDAIHASLTRNHPYDIEFRILRPDKTERIIHTRGEVLRDENGLPIRITGTSDDITERKEAEHALRRLNRTLRTLSRGNEALVRAAGEPELLDDMCRVIVETGGYRMAWVGVPQQDAAKSVTPVAWAGIGAEFFEDPPLHSWAGESEGGCVCGRALNSGQAQTSQDLLKDPAMTLWRARFARHGISACAAFPLRNSTGGFAVLTIYAAEADAFDTDELKLLQELANDLAFGIRSLREHTAREAMDKRWRASLEATIGAIASTVEMRDPYTAGHQLRVARLAVAMARELHLPDEQIEGLYLAGIVHDVGKIDIPAEILSKPGKLSRLQYQLIQAHAQAGYDIVKGVDFPWPIADMVRQHHERLDGSGYPQGLKAEAILPEAKILAVADVVESMMSQRPYRAALGIEAALAEIEQGKGRLYDPAAVEACTVLFRHNGFSFE
jgi:PAS domain S-box-containing protein/putative nucleotidyltransferase with HDIG domain